MKNKKQGFTLLEVLVQESGCHIVPNFLTNANKYSTMLSDEILTK